MLFCQEVVFVYTDRPLSVGDQSFHVLEGLYFLEDAFCLAMPPHVFRKLSTRGSKLQETGWSK